MKLPLRQGFEAKGDHGYSGYLWRHYLKKATVDIWTLKVGDAGITAMAGDPSMERVGDDKKRQCGIVIETIESGSCTPYPRRVWPMA